MSDGAPDSGGPEMSASRSLAARDAAGVMLGLAALLDRRSFDDEVVDPRLIATTIRRLRRVGHELLGADEDDRYAEGSSAPPDGIAWATQLSWLLARARTEGAITGATLPRAD